MKFLERLERAWSSSGSLLCVGLDPDPARLPAQLARSAHPLFEFGQIGRGSCRERV